MLIALRIQSTLNVDDGVYVLVAVYGLPFDMTLMVILFRV